MSWRTIASTLDEEIAELQTRLQGLRARRNSITPFYQLPDEIVARILLMLQLDLDPGDLRLHLDFHDLWTKPRSEPFWVKTMLVCKRFREVALSRPVLWSCIDLEGRNNCIWAQLCRERSFKCPLDLNCVVNTSDLEASGIALDYFAHAHRARFMITTSEIEAHIGVSHFALLEPRLSYSRPLLTDLEIANISDDEASSPWQPPPVVVPTPSFLGGSDINLTSLTLTNVDWLDAPFMPMLKILNINGFYIDKSCRNVQALLRQTPGVTHVNLLVPMLRIDMDTLNEETFPDKCPDSDHSLQLPDLNTLTLSGPLPPLALVLRVLPDPRCHLHVMTQASDDPEDHYEWLLSFDKSFAEYLLTRLGKYMDQAACERTLPLSSASLSSWYSDVIEFHLLSATSNDNASNFSIKYDLVLFPQVELLSTITRHVRHLNIADAKDLPGLAPIIRPCVYLDLLFVKGFHFPFDYTSPVDTVYTDDDMADQQELMQQKECLENLMKTQASSQGSPISRLLMSYRYGDELPDPDIREAAATEWKRAGWVKEVEWTRGL